MLSTVSFFALAIVGLGAVSFAMDADIIGVPGLGQGPGVIGMATAVAVFAGVEWAAVRIARRGLKPIHAAATSNARRLAELRD